MRARRPKGVKASGHFWTSASPPGGMSRPQPVMRGLDPRIHLLCKNILRNRWIAGSSLAMTAFTLTAARRSRRRYRERFGAGQEPRPRALRQGNAVAHSRLQDAVAALARKVDAFDAVSRRKRRNVAREVIRLAQNALAITEHGKIEPDRGAVEKRRIQRAAGGKGSRDDSVADRETAQALDHEGKPGALWPAERQQRRELPGVGGVASLRVQSPAERNLAPGIARAHHLSHGDIRRGHVDQ